MRVHSFHSPGTDMAHDSEYARSGEEAGFTATGRSRHGQESHAENGHRR
jgi:hypothetical protein